MQWKKETLTAKMWLSNFYLLGMKKITLFMRSGKLDSCWIYEENLLLSVKRQNCFFPRADLSFLASCEDVGSSCCVSVTVWSERSIPGGCWRSFCPSSAPLVPPCTKEQTRVLLLEEHVQLSLCASLWYLFHSLETDLGHTADPHVSVCMEGLSCANWMGCRYQQGTLSSNKDSGRIQN